MYNITLIDGRNVTADEGQIYLDIVKKYELENEIPVVLGKFNGKLRELNKPIKESGFFDVVDIRNKSGMRAYTRTLKMILIKATLDLFPGATITIEHSLSKGLFGEIHKETPLNEEEILKIKEKMQDLINNDIEIKREKVTKERAIEIFEEYGMSDRVRVLKHIDREFITLYDLDGYYDCFYGLMAHSTSVIKKFDLIKYESGFILRFPTRTKPLELPKFVEHKKLAKIFYESEQWGKILHVGDLGGLNEIITNGEIGEFIRVNEALHEKKIAYIADMITSKEEVKVVSIAGPSSSGKTSFTNRLGIQLRVNGQIPILISLDDYFVDREKTPKDENGEYDFESIYALDLELFNDHLERLLNGEEIQVPEFNFKIGKREWNGKKLRIPENGILLLEGIHGLNEMLTSSVDKKNKFKIYISCLTQLNVDNHNRIPTTDVRTLRRIVRDTLSRGWDAERTLKMWPSIRRGEERNIFVFQEEADVMFNSNLVYELAVLKKYAIEELKKITSESPVYYEAKKLIAFLEMFKEVDKELVPDNSLLREFVGGSYFYKY
ncbi:nucleoside kinase [Oceanirhabdus sp. W0125-5]|uniref:nucleoside kinase n=1 Tax=Oceanirhabdus sp. W0125-5 TaxID=2999116 RepID=UPI0022F33CBD|nr:nucleoside kinase [Oceanirhabdus sp. W0125-5]WBW98782.1 nucleoside kinase [Oceanirhabdus sp. W0125-5]